MNIRLNILIAEDCELLRVGLRTIFSELSNVANVYEASSNADLRYQVRSNSLDLVIANQSLVTDITHLPRGKFVILTARPALDVLKAVYTHGGRGYLSEKVSAEFLRSALYIDENSFLLEPALTPWMMDYIFRDALTFVREEILTPREKEIIGLLRKGIDRPTIAQSLCIAETTLKTHIKNISRKREASKERNAVLSPS